MSLEAWKLAGPIGDRLAEAAYESLRRELGEAWAEFPAEGKVAVHDAALDLARLTLLSLAGQDVEVHLALVRSTLANWTWVGSEIAKRHLAAALRELAGTAAGIAIRAVL